MGRDDVLIVEQYGPARLSLGNQVVHPVEDPQQGALATSGRSDDRGDPPLGDIERDFVKGLEPVIEERQVVDLHLGFPCSAQGSQARPP